MASDGQYAIARQLLDLGNAVACLREEAGLTRSELGKQLRVKARDIAVVEEETPRAPAGLLSCAKSSRPNADAEHAKTIRSWDIASHDSASSPGVGANIIGCAISRAALSVLP